MKQILKTLEMIIFESRMIAILAVVASAVSAVILFVYGSLEILDLFKGFWQALTGKGEFMKSHSYLISKIINAVVLYLVGTLMYVMAAGMQALYIGKLETGSNDANAGRILQIQSLEQFKERMISVIHIILVVLFFRFSLSMDYVAILNLVYLAVGIVLIAGSVYLSNKK